MKFQFLFIAAMTLPPMLISCQTTKVARLSEQNQSLNEVRAAMTKVVGDFRRVSENQREFYSKYFSPSDEEDFDPNKSQERAYAKFTILGDRRPYEIEAIVVLERRDKGRYESIDTDLKAAEELLREVKTNLNKSLDKRNIIDDFRAF